MLLIMNLLIAMMADTYAADSEDSGLYPLVRLVLVLVGLPLLAMKAVTYTWSL